MDVPPGQNVGVDAAAQQLLEGALDGVTQAGLTLGDDHAVKPGFVLRVGRKLVLRLGTEVVDEEHRGRKVVQHCDRATRAQLQEGVRVGRVGLHDDPLCVAVALCPREQVHLGRTLLDGDHLAAQVVELGDAGRVAALHDDRRSGAEVVDKVGGLGALRGVCHRRHGEVQVTARDVREQVGEVGSDELEANSQDAPDLDAQVGLHTDDGAAIGPVRRHGRVGGVGADPQDAPVLDRLREQVVQRGIETRLMRRGRAGGCRAGRCRAARCRKRGRQSQDDACSNAAGTGVLSY